MAPEGNPVPDTLFIFIDESGNFDFSPKGTRHFVMAAVSALAPLSTAATMQAIRYRLLAQGHDVPGFHASEDRQFVRDHVFQAMSEMKFVRTHVVHGNKSQLDATLRNDAALHALFAGELMQCAISAHPRDEYRQTVVVFDQALPRSKQAVFHSTVKPQLKLLGKPFHLYFQPMITDMNGQLADYIAWSKFVQLERNEQRPWACVSQNFEVSEYDVCA